MPTSANKNTLLELSNDVIRLELSPIGARLRALYLKENNHEINIAIGLASEADYHALDTSMGAICGRFANRIAKAQYSDNGNLITLAANEGKQQLHGGPVGFDQQQWTIDHQTTSSISFSLISADGDQGFPGKVEVSVTYTLTGNRLRCEFIATSDKRTPINLTHHAYWNLSGQWDISAANHFLQINADSYLATDETQIPTQRYSVANTDFDFTHLRRISDAKLPFYDHNFCLNGTRGELAKAATLSDPATGRSLTVSTTEPGLQFYLSKHFSNKMMGPEKQKIHQQAGIALEPQAYPDSPNRPDFPSCWLEPESTYRHTIEWQFLKADATE